MGYHTAHEIPNYWSYARHFVLDDHMFEPNASWSLPAHLYMVSEWSARCSHEQRRRAARRNIEAPQFPPDFNNPHAHPARLRVDRSHLAAAPQHVSWRYYVMTGTEPDCENASQTTCSPVAQNAKTPGIWNPLPYFETSSRTVSSATSSLADQLLPRRRPRDAPGGVVDHAERPVSEHPPASREHRDRPTSRG